MTRVTWPGQDMVTEYVSRACLLFPNSAMMEMSAGFAPEDNES